MVLACLAFLGHPSIGGRAVTAGGRRIDGISPLHTHWRMDDQFLFLRSVVSRLEQAEIPYMLTGSLALALYAEPRMTRDIDVVIECDEERAATLVALFQDDSYADVDAARTAARETGMFNVIHLESLVKADFIVKPTTPYETIKFNRRRRVDLGGFDATVISPEDLVLSKLLWARGSESVRQIDDVRTLLEQVPALDRSYLAEWSVRLDLVEALARADRS